MRTNYAKKQEPMTEPSRYIEGAVCPACEKAWLRPSEPESARSRFCDKYICSTCGAREAFTGFFWLQRALERGARLNEAGQELVQKAHREIPA